MPSGAKKRKAANKKRVKEANNSNDYSKNPQGNSDPKSQDERESDGGDVGSPVSHEQHCHQHPFDEGNGKSEKGGPPLAHSFVHENKPMEVVPGDTEGGQKVELEDDKAVKIGREVISDQNVESKDVFVEHVDSPKESHDGDDRTSSRSSSDDESKTFEKSKESNAEGMEVGSLSEKMKQIPENDNPVEEATSDSVVETVSAVDLVTPVLPMFETAKGVMESAEVENPEVLEVVESGFEKDEGKMLPVSNEVFCASSAVSSPKENDDKLRPILDEKVGVSWDVVDSSLSGNAGKTSALSGTHSAEVYNGAEKPKESSESIEKQPLLTSAPRIVERSSWKSCCGIFELFTGSNR